VRFFSVDQLNASIFVGSNKKTLQNLTPTGRKLLINPAIALGILHPIVARGGKNLPPEPFSK
jgi:hypothetical protein